MIGGGSASSSVNSYNKDVWYSSDGVTWTQATASANFGERSGHTSVVFDNKIWVIGGYDVFGNHTNSVWHSSDGVTWTQATPSANFGARSYHESVVYDGKIWVIGGLESNPSTYKNDAWYSSDGVTWKQATSSANFSARYSHQCVVFNNKIWVIGGQGSGPDNNNDVWYSSDGVTWTQATASANFGSRRDHSSVVHNSNMWVIMGWPDLTSNDSYYNDAWTSSDGVSWTQCTSSLLSQGGRAIIHCSVVFNDKIWIIGGADADDPQTNDVWYSN